MDERSLHNIEDTERILGHPTGMGRIQRGECPLKNTSDLACMTCDCGHLLECHYPLTCDEAKCSHWTADQVFARELPGKAVRRDG